VDLGVIMSHRGALLAGHHRSAAFLRLKGLLQSLPATSLRGEEELVDDVQGDAQHRGAGDRPAHLVAPVRVVVLLAEHLLVAHDGEYEDGLRGYRYYLLNLNSFSFIYQQEYGTNVGPADPPEQTRLAAQHLFHIRAEAIYSVEPKHSGCLYEDHKKNGQSGSVDIQEIDQHHSTLK